jgi:neutral ceramidase
MKRMLLAAALAQVCLWGEFRAAVVKVDITPKDSQPLLGFEARRSKGVHDPLYHRVLALDDGSFQFFLVATDIALISPSVYDDFCREMKSKLGIERKQLWWTNTHTHSAPEVGPPGLPEAFMPDRYKHSRDMAYTEFVKSKLLEAIGEARAQLAPARLAVGSGFSMANINRRAKDVDGKVKLGLNPYGPVDRQIGLLRIEKSDGKLMGVVANYAIHGTALGPANLEISGDVPGLVAAYVESKLNAPVLFVNGAAGDTAPLYSGPSFRAAHITEFNVLLGDRILEALEGMGAGTAQVKLRSAEVIVESPRKPGLGWVKDLEAYATADGKGVKLPVRFLSINGEAMLWAAPLELFSEIALEVRQQSPFRFTFFCGFTNGWLGYLTTAKGYAEGGYEVDTSPFTARAERDLREAVLRTIQGWPE